MKCRDFPKKKKKKKERKKENFLLIEIGKGQSSLSCITVIPNIFSIN
jgi:hypothetical protein